MTLIQHQKLHFKNTQSGVVLFLAMIALVVMSLAAVALIRSVDTNSMIAGNLTYKQTAAVSSSYGIESMADDIGAEAIAFGNANNAARGYYATCTTFDVGAANRCNGANLTADASWVPGTTSRWATGLPGVSGGVDPYGNRIQYIVERMCDAVGTPTKAACLLATADLDNNSKNVLNEPNAGAPEVLSDISIYRVTVRITGPKNTVSYIQAFIS
jgi:type IV pilus assembly protein PilX